MEQQPKIQLPKTNQYKRTSTIEYPIIYHLLSTYMMTLLKNPKLNKNEKQIRLVEMGRKLGQNVMESLASTQFEKISLNPDQGKYTDYVKFFGKDFWTYLFGQSVSKVQINKVSTIYEIEDRYEEVKKGNNTITKLGFQMTRRIKLNDKVQQDEYLQLWASMVQGLVIGGMKALTIDCDSEVEFINNEVKHITIESQVTQSLLYKQRNFREGETSDFIILYKFIMDLHEHKENYYDPNIVKRKRTYQKQESMNPVVETFIDICKKLDYSSRDYLRMVIPIDEPKDQLQCTDQIIILNYLKQIAIYLIKSKLELEDKLCNQTDGKQFEAELQTMEADIRQHIRVQQQLQIFIEQAQQRIEEFESQKLKSEQIITDLTQVLESKKREVMTLQSEISEIKERGRQKAPFQATKTEPIQSSIDHLDNLQLFTLVENSPTRNNFTQVQGAIRKGRNQQLSKEPLKPKGDNTPQRCLRETVESPEKIVRKFSQPNYMEINALRLLIKKPCPLNSRSELSSFRSNSQEAQRLPKKS